MTYPSHCCQKCGDAVGWIGRLFQAALFGGCGCAAISALSR